MDKSKAKAIKFGTFTSPTDGRIIYVDPKHDSEEHHSPELTPAETQAAIERGLIQDPNKPEPQDPEAGTGERQALERTAEHAELDHKIDRVPSALDSRQSTAWPDAERVLGGAEGFADGQRNSAVTATDLAPDAAPAPGTPAPSPTPTPKPAPKPATAKASAKRAAKAPAKTATPKPGPAALKAAGGVTTQSAPDAAPAPGTSNGG